MCLPFSNQPSYFPPHPAFFMSSLGLHFFHRLQKTCLPSTSRSKVLITTILNPQHMTYQCTQIATTNRSIVSMKHNININSPCLFLSLNHTPHVALTMDLSVLHKICISLSITMIHFYTELQAIHNSCKQPLSALKETSFHTALTSCSGSHSSLTAIHSIKIVFLT